MKKRKGKTKRNKLIPIIVFTVSWLFFAVLLPVKGLWGLITNLILCTMITIFCNMITSHKDSSSIENSNGSDVSAEDEQSGEPSSEADQILIESGRALSEMARIYKSVNDTEIKSKINEIMRITDKIAQDAVEDPSDIPQIKRFFNYYLPTTIKLLNSYDRMSSQQIDGENIEKSMKNINDMLDTAIAAYKKRLDSLFENQAIDIETDIDVMNTLLMREGLSNKKEF